MDLIGENIVAFALSFFLAVILTPGVRYLSVKTNCVACPRQDRWHSKATGLFGGIAIFLSMTGAWLFSGFYFLDFHLAIAPMVPIAVAATGIFLLGLIDDIFDINPQYKLIGQVVIASVLVFLGFHATWFDSMTANQLVSIFWIVGITNAFNLLDNMDGLSAGVALISGCFLLLWLIVEPGVFPHKQAQQVLMLAYLGGVAGFLVYNFYPASIFMGDAGSLLIGFLLSVMMMEIHPVEAGERTVFNQISVIFTPVLILFVPIVDTTFVSLMRKITSRSIFQGGTDHASHRMVAKGLSEPRAVLVLYFFSILSGIIALTIIPLDLFVSIFIIGVYLLLVMLFWTYLGNVDVYGHAGGSPAIKRFSNRLVGGYGKTFLCVVFDLLLITMAYYAAYLLRFEGNIGPDFGFFLKSLPIMIACQISAFYFFGQYQNVWEGSRLGDMVVYFKGVTAGTVAAMLVLLFLYRFQYFSRAVFVIYWGLMLILVVFSRFFFKLLDEQIYKANGRGKPTLIYGAGIGGQMAVKEIENNSGLGLTIKGFIDDNPKLKGKKIYGYPVYGSIHDFANLAGHMSIKEVIISFKPNGCEPKKEILQICEKTGCEIEVKQMKLEMN
jgi:UDP-GlcNAc:undecaprenyl-phosphate GlcNAc-1-phosphate transferase